jgi:HEAT repeat protein
VNGSSYTAPKSELLLLKPNQSQTLNLAGPMGDSGCEPPDALAVHEITCGMPSPVQGVPEPEPVLEKNHIDLSKDALIAALQSKAAQVRLAAADALAARWPSEAVSPIESALRNESDETIRIDLAFTLAKLGKRTALSNLCHSPREWGSTRMQAAMMMCQLKDDSCVDSVLKTLRSTSDPNDPRAKWNAMELVPSLVGHLSKEESDRVLALVVDALNDPSEDVRIVASQTINELGFLEGIPQLEAAIAREQDENTRAQMEGELNWLKQAQKAHCEHGLSTDGRCFAPPVGRQFPNRKSSIQ